MITYRTKPPIRTPIALTFVTYNALQLSLHAEQTREGVIADQAAL